MDATVLAAVLTFCSTLASAYLKDALPTGGPMPLPEDLCTRAGAQLFRMAASSSNSALAFHDLAVCFLFWTCQPPAIFPANMRQNILQCLRFAIFQNKTPAGAPM